MISRRLTKTIIVLIFIFGLYLSFGKEVFGQYIPSIECRYDSDCGCGLCCAYFDPIDNWCYNCTRNPCPTNTPTPTPLYGGWPTNTPAPGGPTNTPVPCPGCPDICQCDIVESQGVHGCWCARGCWQWTCANPSSCTQAEWISCRANPGCPAECCKTCISPPGPNPTATPIPTNTPTPTFTPTPTQAPWKKIKNSSFQTKTNLVNNIPSVVVSFDTDDTVDPYFIIGSGGIVSGQSIALNLYNPLAKVSENDWKVSGYTPRIKFTKSTFLSYIKSRKDYSTKERAGFNIASLTTPGIYYVENTDPATTLTINTDPITDLVLIVDGDVDITLNNFNTEGGIPRRSVAILADKINFASTISYASGIFVADTVNTGTNTDLGLKIKGNLVASTFNNNRKQNTVNNQKPAVFIVFYPQTYLNLLNYLSIDKYEWRQIQ